MVDESDIGMLLKERFNADGAAGIDACFVIDWDSGHVVFSISDRSLEIVEAEDAAHAEVIIFCSSRDLAYGLFAGTENPIDAFMHGHLRSNGYLVLVFRVLGAFSGR